MQFFRPRDMKSTTNPAVLWDAGRGKARFEFVKGVCEVPDADTQTVQLMKDMGYYYQNEDGVLTTQAEERLAKINAEANAGGGSLPTTEPQAEPAKAADPESAIAPTPIGPAPIKRSAKPRARGK